MNKNSSRISGSNNLELMLEYFKESMTVSVISTKANLSSNTYRQDHGVEMREHGMFTEGNLQSTNKGE